MKFKDYLNIDTDTLCCLSDAHWMYCELEKFHTGKHKFAKLCHTYDKFHEYHCVLPKNHSGKHIATSYAVKDEHFVFKNFLREWKP